MEPVHLKGGQHLLIEPCHILAMIVHVSSLISLIANVNFMLIQYLNFFGLVFSFFSFVVKCIMDII